jgi:hypothetical protein
MKKMMLLMLTLLIWSAASMKAQVAIGSDKNPHSGAVLDLQSTTQGLKLPNVALDNDLTVFKLPVTAPSTKEDAKGMYVYNTNPAIGEGVYVWDGYQWILVKGSIGEKPVEYIVISPVGGSMIVRPGSKLQLNAEVLPLDASNQTLVWSIDNRTGTGSIVNTGSFTGGAEGIVTVRAVAQNGVEDVMNIVVSTKNTTTTMRQNGTKNYLTCDLGGDVWMVQNSSEREDR